MQKMHIGFLVVTAAVLMSGCNTRAEPRTSLDAIAERLGSNTVVFLEPDGTPRVFNTDGQPATDCLGEDIPSLEAARKAVNPDLCKLIKGSEFIIQEVDVNVTTFKGSQCQDIYVKPPGRLYQICW
jgi:hypothetical protein